LQSKYTHWIYEADVICIKGLSVWLADLDT
jgi:hypothetical protein